MLHIRHEKSLTTIPETEQELVDLLAVIQLPLLSAPPCLLLFLHSASRLPFIALEILTFYVEFAEAAAAPTRAQSRLELSLAKRHLLGP